MPSHRSSAGCGSDDVKDLAGGDIAKAAERTAAQKTARMTMTMQMSGMGLPGTVELDATGVMDLTKPRGTIALDLGRMLQGFGLPQGMLGDDASSSCSSTVATFTRTCPTPR